MIYQLPDGKTLIDHDKAVAAAARIARDSKQVMVSLLEYAEPPGKGVYAVREIVVRPDGSYIA